MNVVAVMWAVGSVLFFGMNVSFISLIEHVGKIDKTLPKSPSVNWSMVLPRAAIMAAVWPVTIVQLLVTTLTSYMHMMLLCGGEIEEITPDYYSKLVLKYAMIHSVFGWAVGTAVVCLCFFYLM